MKQSKSRNSTPGGGGYYYLASPYSNKEPGVVLQRVRSTMEALAELRLMNLVVYSPILHWHETASSFVLPTDAKSWEAQNFVMQSEARAGLIVLEIPGWRESIGVGMEIDLALRLRQPIKEFVPTIGENGRRGWLLMDCKGDPR